MRPTNADIWAIWMNHHLASEYTSAITFARALLAKYAPQVAQGDERAACIEAARKRMIDVPQTPGDEFPSSHGYAFLLGWQDRAALSRQPSAHFHMYAELCEAMGYDAGKDGLEWSPEEWAAELLRIYRSQPSAWPNDWPDQLKNEYAQGLKDGQAGAGDALLRLMPEVLASLDASGVNVSLAADLRGQLAAKGVI